MSNPSADEKQMRLRYAGTCRLCGAELPAKSVAVYERSTKTVRCVEHAPEGPESPAEEGHEVAGVPDSATVDEGTPGASARREFERRQKARERRVRSKHPKIGGFLLAVTEEPQSTSAWDTGATGEERLGSRLNDLSSATLRVLHDRRIPGSRANIDHIAVTPNGVWVIDAKKYKGRPQLKVEGGLLRPRVEKLLVGSRDCTKVVDGVLKQIEVVAGALGTEVPVRGVLCFVEADWPLVGGAFAISGVSVTWPKRMYKLLGEAGPLGEAEIADVHRRLAEALPPA